MLSVSDFYRVRGLIACEEDEKKKKKTPPARITIFLRRPEEEKEEGEVSESSSSEEEEEEEEVEKQYRCTHCTFKTNYQRGFKNHMRVKHGNAVQGDFECDVCHKKYDGWRALQRHRRYVHSTLIEEKSTKAGGPRFVPCKYCQFKGISEMGLNVHMFSKHQDRVESKHVCKVCKRKFATRHNMLRHMLDFKHN